jgi:signal transduction histidine kinase
MPAERSTSTPHDTPSPAELPAANAELRATNAELRAANAELRARNAELRESSERAVQLRDEFLAIASHELRTPLTALSLQLENVHALLNGAGNQTGREVLDDKLGHALRYTGRLARLIDGLLAVSRIMAGRFSLRLEDVDLSEITRKVVERMHPDAARARCTISMQTSGAVRGRWDALRLEQIVTNLLANAFRHAPGAPVNVRVNSNGRCAVLSVEDGGPGIAHERLPLIFERYEVAGERNASGLGLGLYIIRQIAEAHGGRVCVHTELGHGARFVVELPFDGQPPRRSDALAARQDPS